MPRNPHRSRNATRSVCRFLACFVFAVQLACIAAVAGTATTNNIASGRFITPSHVHDSGKPGPIVMIVGGAHGNEPAGALAAESVRHWPISSGRLVVIPRANVPALEAGKRNTPGLTTNLSNLNRNFPRDGQDEPPRGELANAIWSLAVEQRPDWLLDLHEGFDFNQINDKSVGSSVICFPHEKGTPAAKLMLDALNHTISEEQLKFVLREMPVDGSLARAAGEHLKIPSMTLETTSKQPMAKRVRQHEVMVHALLRHLGMLEMIPPPAVIAEQTEIAAVKDAEPNTAQLRVALYKGPGTGGDGPPSLMQRLNNPPASIIQQVTPEEIRAGVLKYFDLVVFAGGSGSKQAEAIGEEGREIVKQFVANGGGYVGICAGAYLATSGYPWSLGLVNARTVSPKWQRGKTMVKLEMTDGGENVLGVREGQFDCRYANGPIVKPDSKPDLPPFDTLALYRTEVASNGAPVGVMIDSPAIFSAQYRQGRVICVSPHPEQTAGLEELVPNAIRWVAPREKVVSNNPVPKAE
jgi:predicted deacylase/putative intracellular protease/amidase